MNFETLFKITLIVLLIAAISGCNSADQTLGQGQQSPTCKGNARCFQATVYSTTDGDTINIEDEDGDTYTPIRLALTNTPEKTEPGFREAKNFTETLCPPKSVILVDEDDGQKEGSYDRVIGVIYCNGKNLNEELLRNNHAEIDQRYCKTSEFAQENWAKEFGC